MSFNVLKVTARFEKTPRIVQVESLDPLRERLESWEWLASGAYAAAFAKGNLVWKIQKLNALEDDTAYPTFVRGLLDGSVTPGPHTPRIRLMLIDEKGGFAVLMERLVRTWHEEMQIDDHIWRENERTHRQLRTDPRLGHMHTLDDQHYAMCPLLSVRLMEIQRSVMGTHMLDENNKPYIMNRYRGIRNSVIVREDSVLRKFGEQALKLSDHGLCWDLHGNNLMFRRNGDIVITDPLC